MTTAASDAYDRLLRAVGFRITRADVDAGHNLSLLDIKRAVRCLHQHFEAGAPPFSG